MKKNWLVNSVSIATIIMFSFYTATPVFAYCKDETVYGKLDSEGNVYETKVTDHLKNNDEVQVLKDMSELLNIKNINGDESFDSENSNILKWNSNGNDIYYEGENKKELPIDCMIKYELDGKEISVNDLAGKSGNVKITLEYKNKDSHIVKINGEDETMYTPFVIMTGIVLDNTKAKNISITNGKTMDNGNKTLLTGVTCPGLQESLGLDESEIDIPSRIEITFEASDFEMNNIVSYAVPKIIEQSDFSVLDKLNDLYSKVSILSDSSKMLVQGVRELQVGVNTYVEKNKEFGSAIDTLQNGISTVNDNYGLLDDGINKLNSSADVLKQGAYSVDDGVSNVSLGLNQLQTGISNGKNTAVSTLSKSAKELGEGVDGLIYGKDQEAEVIKTKVVDGANESLKSNIQAAQTAQAQESINKLNEVLNDESLNLTQEQINQIKESMMKQLDSSTINAKTGYIVDATSEKQKESIDMINNSDTGVKAGLNTLKIQAGASMQNGINSLAAGFDDISTGVNKVSQGTEQLKTGTSRLYQGTEELSVGTQTFVNKSGLLKSGILTLNNGAIAIKNANKQLIVGSENIKSGVNTLAEGFVKFDNEGIQEIFNLVNNKVKNIQERIEALMDLADEYNNFSGIDKDADGIVKFILMTDGIKKKEND